MCSTDRMRASESEQPPPCRNSSLEHRQGHTVTTLCATQLFASHCSCSVACPADACRNSLIRCRHAASACARMLRLRSFPSVSDQITSTKVGGCWPIKCHRGTHHVATESEREGPGVGRSPQVGVERHVVREQLLLISFGFSCAQLVSSAAQFGSACAQTVFCVQPAAQCIA